MPTRGAALSVIAGLAALAIAGWALLALRAGQALDRIRVAQMSWERKTGYLMKARFVLENGNAFDVTDIEVTCRQIDEAGKEIDLNRRVLAIVIPANGTLAVPDHDMGVMHAQTQASACRVTDYRAGSMPSPS